MDYSQKISERLWNLPDKGMRESLREKTFIDDIVQKSHIEKELLKSLDGVKTVFDGGGGSGRFSILLAERGIKVTHFDISQPMLDQAREAAEKAGVTDSIEFVKGALEDLTAFADRSFDLVMSFDAPISYTYPNQERVIRELVRMARKKVMFSVSSRLGSLPYYANPLNKNQFILNESSDDPWVKWCLLNKEKVLDEFRFDKTAASAAKESGLIFSDIDAIAEQYEKGESPWVITYGFLPDELETLLSLNGVNNIRLAGPGAFARTLPHEVLKKLMDDPAQKADFLDFCFEFDSNRYVCGMGKDNLLAIGDLPLQ